MTEYARFNYAEGRRNDGLAGESNFKRKTIEAVEGQANKTQVVQCRAQLLPRIERGDGKTLI